MGRTGPMVPTVGEEADAVPFRILLQERYQTPQVEGLTVIGEIPGEGDQADPPGPPPWSSAARRSKRRSR